MASLVLFLVTLCVLTYSRVDADEDCKKAFQNMKKKMNEMMESGDAPQCVDDYKLKDFQCTGGEDEEADKKMHEDFMDHYKKQNDEDKDGIKKCITDMVGAIIEEVDMSDECKEEVKKIGSKMTGEES